MFEHLLDDGSQLGIRLSYAEQPRPEGLAQAFIIGRNFIGNDTVVLILGDNIFYGESLSEKLQVASQLKTGSIVFGYQVNEPERYGVLEFDSKKKISHFN